MTARHYALPVALWLSLAVAVPARAQEPRLPVSEFFANPDFDTPVISPDGKTLAVLLSDGNLQVVATRALAGGPFTPIVRLQDPKIRVGWLEWANNDRILISAHQRMRIANGSRPQTFLYGVDRDGKNYRWLGKDWPSYEGVGGKYPVQFQDDVIARLPRDPQHVLLSYWPPDKSSPSVMNLEVNTGQLRVRQREERGIQRWHADPNGEIRVAEGEDRDTYTLRARLPGETALSEVAHHNPLSDDGVRFGGFHEDPRKLYVIAGHDGRDAIFEFDIAGKTRGKLVFAHPEVDVRRLQTEPGTGQRVVGVYFETDRPQLHFFDAAVEKEHAGLGKALGDEFDRPVYHETVSESDDGMIALLRVSTDDQPSAYYVFDRRRKALSHLFDQFPRLASRHFATTQPIYYLARDGLRIPAYLTLPVGSTGSRAPSIVLPHGGPRARDVFGWDGEVQLLANRGFAVLQMNFRGSDGYGKAHLEAGRGEWGRKIQDDISDGVAMLVAEGFADPDRIGIYGESYGGYAALVGATKTAELYRAAAAYAPVTDIEMLLDDEAKREAGGERQRPALGGESGDKNLLRESSPLRLAGNAGVPILLGHAEEDDLVNVRHSRKMADALRKAGKEFEYLEFPLETHDFELEANRLKWYEALVAFFEKNLAPRKKPGAKP